MFWKLFIVVFLVATAVAIVVEHAVTSSNVYTIANVRAADSEVGTVTIHGTVSYASDNTFAIQDGTGTAELVTCPTWYKRIYLFPGDEVTVIGEVLKSHSIPSKTNITISVYKILRNGKVLEVRDRPGKPPWAEGTNR